MSKLSNLAGIPSKGGGAGANVLGPLKGIAPGWDGVPTGAPSGLHKAVGDVSSPLGGLQAGADGTPQWRNAPIDGGQNALVNPAPPPPPPGPGYSVWGDPDISKRGWGWGMGADGALHTGVMGGGPAGSIFGPSGSAAAPAPSAAPQATGQGNANLGQLGRSVATGLQGGLGGFGQQLAQGIRQFNANGGMGQQGAAMPAGGPQGMPAGVMPQGAPNPAQNPQAVQALIAQMRSQQQGYAQ